MLFRDQWVFTRAWLRNPVGISAVAPSSQALASAMASQVPLDGRAIIELGGGTGSITTGLLRAGVAPRALYVLERDEGLCEVLRGRFPNVRILAGDASDLSGLWADHGPTDDVGAVVSSLPLLSMSCSLQRNIIGAVLEATDRKPPIVQFSYGLHCPVSNGLLRSLNMRAYRTARVWRNLPPASVWRLEARPTRVASPCHDDQATPAYS